MTNESEAFEVIEAHRANIDELDVQIVALLNDRAKESLAIRTLKPSAHLGLFDPKREEEIFERVEAVNNGPMYNDDVRTIYAAILRVMKELRA